MVVEQIVELDEDLMMRYLEGETVEPDELRRTAHDAIAQGKLVPVLCVCTRKDVGLRELLDLISNCGLSPSDIHRFGTRGAEADAPEEEILPAEDGTLVAQVFKTVNDQFMGKLSYLRILSGRLGSDTTIVNLRSGKTSQGRPHLHLARQAARGGARGDRRRHRGHRQVRRPARVRHGQQRRAAIRPSRSFGPDRSSFRFRWFPGPSNRRRATTRPRSRPGWPRSPTKTRHSRSGATPRRTSS